MCTRESLNEAVENVMPGRLCLRKAFDIHGILKSTIKLN